MNTFKIGFFVILIHVNFAMGAESPRSVLLAGTQVPTQEIDCVGNYVKQLQDDANTIKDYAREAKEDHRLAMEYFNNAKELGKEVGKLYKEVKIFYRYALATKKFIVLISLINTGITLINMGFIGKQTYPDIRLWWSLRQGDKPADVLYWLKKGAATEPTRLFDHAGSAVNRQRINALRAFLDFKEKKSHDALEKLRVSIEQQKVQKADLLKSVAQKKQT